MVLDGVCLSNMRSMSFKAHFAEKRLLSQAVELRRFIKMKFKLIKVNAKVVMRSNLTRFWRLICFLPLRTQFNDWFLFFINFDSNFLVLISGTFYYTCSLWVILFNFNLLNIHLRLLNIHLWRSIWVDLGILAKSIFLRFHLFEKHSSLKIVISFFFTLYLFFDLISHLLISLQHLDHVMRFFKRLLLHSRCFQWQLSDRSYFDWAALTENGTYRWLNRISNLLQSGVSSFLCSDVLLIGFDNILTS